MARLLYTGITSLDGYVADESGRFDWSAPDEEVHAFVNELERSVGTYLLGRRMYDVLSVWETWDTTGEPDVIREYADIWRDSDKVVFSSTLEDPVTARTRIEREFHPGRVRAWKAEADRDLSIGGPHLAVHALRAGLVDEVQLFVSPVAVGGGNRFLPDGLRVDLELQAERRFGNGVVFLRYGVAGASPST
jgi:dihydrofolate reductase